MSVYDLPFCDVCGYPFKDGKPTCDCTKALTCSPLPSDCPQLNHNPPPEIEGISCQCCKERGIVQEDRDDEAVVRQICSKQKQLARFHDTRGRAKQT